MATIRSHQRENDPFAIFVDRLQLYLALAWYVSRLVDQLITDNSSLSV